MLGLNEYLGWYGGRPEDADRMQWKFAWDKPVIMSEFGAEAPYGRHGEADERWTEEYQANLYQHQITMLKKIPSLAGMSPWVLMDFHSPRRLLPGTRITTTVRDWFRIRDSTSRRSTCCRSSIGKRNAREQMNRRPQASLSFWEGHRLQPCRQDSGQTAASAAVGTAS